MAKLIILNSAGERREIDTPCGQSVMQIVRDLGYDLEGACEGALACATCHVIVDAEWYAKLGAVTADEADMLDFADDLSATSRLSCQITMSDELDGLTISLPATS